MKKWMALLLAVTMALSVAACGKKNAEPTDSTGATEQTAQKTPLTGTMEENVNKIMEQNPAQFMGGQMAVDLQDTTEDGLWALKGFTGLDSPEKIQDIAVYEPMTGAQAFSLVLVRVKDGADAKTVARQMKDNIDPRKWICAMADQVMAAGYEDVVLFVMVDSQLGLTAQSYVDTFASICGGKLDFTI